MTTEEVEAEVRQAILAERARCLAWAQAAREGLIDSDMRLLIAVIRSGAAFDRKEFE